MQGHGKASSARTARGSRELFHESESEWTKVFMGCLTDSKFPVTGGDQPSHTSTRILPWLPLAISNKETPTRPFFFLLESSIQMCPGQGLSTRCGLTILWLPGPVIWRKSLFIRLDSKKSEQAPRLKHSMTYRQRLKNEDLSRSDSEPWNSDCPAEEVGQTAGSLSGGF